MYQYGSIIFQNPNSCTSGGKKDFNLISKTLLLYDTVKNKEIMKENERIFNKLSGIVTRKP